MEQKEGHTKMSVILSFEIPNLQQVSSHFFCVCCLQRSPYVPRGSLNTSLIFHFFFFLLLFAFFPSLHRFFFLFVRFQDVPRQSAIEKLFAMAIAFGQQLFFYWFFICHFTIVSHQLCIINNILHFLYFIWLVLEMFEKDEENGNTSMLSIRINIWYIIFVYIFNQSSSEHYLCVYLLNQKRVNTG